MYRPFSVYKTAFCNSGTIYQFDVIINIVLLIEKGFERETGD